jgi:hypothetical protein
MHALLSTRAARRYDSDWLLLLIEGPTRFVTGWPESDALFLVVLFAYYAALAFLGVNWMRPARWPRAALVGLCVAVIATHTASALWWVAKAWEFFTGPLPCSRLASIRQVPFHSGDAVVDATYLEVMSLAKHRREAALLRCVVDTTPMEDPRKAPPHPGFVVGDAAVILLSESTGIPFENALPPEVFARWSERGVYAYFEYVGDPANRAVLAERWRALVTHGAD